MIDEHTQRVLFEAISNTFLIEEINHIGESIDKTFNIYRYAKGETLTKEFAARVLVSYFARINRLEDLIGQVLSMDGVKFRGHYINLKDSHELLTDIRRAGYVFNPTTKKLERARQAGEEKRGDWGFLKDGTSYEFTFLKLDVAGSSRMVRRYNKRDVEYVYKGFYDYIKDRIERRDGRIWNWQGDGGLCAFHRGDTVNASTTSAIDILLGMIVFNAESNILPEEILLRLALHQGRAVFRENKGNIISEDINFVSHLEESGTDAGGISISDTVYRGLVSRLRKYFVKADKFEGRQTYKFRLILGRE